MSGKRVKKNIEIIAEIANSHQGNPDTALELAKNAVAAGADAVKFQIYFAEELLTNSHPEYIHFKNQSFTKNIWCDLIRETKSLGINVYSDVFGLRALELALDNNIDGVKIHSSDLSNIKLLNKLAIFKKKIFLATGGSTILEVHYAISHIIKPADNIDLVLLHGYQAYPTKIENTFLSRLKMLYELFGDMAEIGYSDHMDAEDKFATIVPMMAIPYGISCIEKHITLNRKNKGTDYYSSFEPQDFKKFILDIRNAEKALGKNPLMFSNSERKYRNTCKKNWVASKNLKAGELIKDSNIIMKRYPGNTPPLMFEEIIGKNLIADINKDEPISGLNIEHKILAIIVARLDSRRLPNKAILDINGKPALSHLFERMKIALQKKYVDTVAFCTTKESSDDRLVDIAKNYPFKIYRGAVENVLERMMLAIEDNNDHDIVLRITGDDLFIDIDYIKKTVEYHLNTNAHYTDANGLPSGTEVEVFNAYLLKFIHEFSKDSSGTEYLTNYIKHNSDQFNISSLKVRKKHAMNYRLTLDTDKDYEVIKRVLTHMKSIGKEHDYSLDDIIAFLNNNPEVFDINRTVHKKKSLKINMEMDWKISVKSPLVTVYITNYNYVRYIKQSIDSVLSQNFSDFELLIIDDGSTDNSKQILERYRKHPKIKIIYQQNKGLNVTNNIAMNLAKGKYIIRLDADDYFDESALLVMVNKLEHDKELGLVFPDYYYVDHQGKVFAQERRHDFKKVTLLDQPAHGACTMIRKEYLQQLGGYSKDFRCQDGYELWIKFAGHYKIENINLPLFYYRQHRKNLTKNQHKILETRHNIIKKHTQHMNIKTKNHICIVPIRGDEEGVPFAIKPFTDTTLLDIVLKNALNTENISKIVLTSPNDKIIEYTKDNYNRKILIDKRPNELAGLNTRLERTVDYLLDRYKEYFGSIDTLSLINYQYPLRKKIYIDMAINNLYVFDVDSVISVKQKNSNFYKHEGTGLIPFDTNRNLRLEREHIYEATGGIHTIKYDSYKKYNSWLTGKVGHILIDELSSRIVSDDLDLEVLATVYDKILKRNVKV